ncbi:MAG TPA: DUF1549 domain-containing protein [Planctomycetaceae bacterium]|jgi:hypothetical protein
MVRRLIPALLAALGGLASIALVLTQGTHRAQAQAPASTPGRAPAHPRQGHSSDDLALRIDLKFEELWKDIGIEQKEVVDDATYLRRVYLDLVGTIPSVAQTRDFLNDENPEKRRKLVEQLVAEPRSSAHLSRVFRRIMVPGGSPGMMFAPQFTAWLQQQFTARVPYDKLARELITAKGNVTFAGFNQDQPVRNGSPVAFYMAVGSTPDSAASSLSRVFLGVRIGCAKCHNHPFADWRQEDFWGMAAFFAGANLTGQPNMPVEDGKVTTIKPMEGKGEYAIRFLWSDTPASLPKDKTPRQMLADWLVSKDNPNFAATAVNRVWQQLCGQGLIPHVDDLDQAPPKERAVVLDDLAREFAAADFDLQWLIEGICKSRVYQRLSETREHPAEDSPLSPHRPLKSLSPEQVFDSLEQALMLPVGRSDQSPRHNRQGATFMQRLNEATSDSPDQFKAGIPQALLIMNGVLVSNATDLEESRTLRAVVDAPFLETQQKIEALYLAALTRKPDAKELDKMLSYLNQQTDKEERRKAYTDIYWAILNSPEFVLSR